MKRVHHSGQRERYHSLLRHKEVEIVPFFSYSIKRVSQKANYTITEFRKFVTHSCQAKIKFTPFRVN